MSTPHHSPPLVIFHSSCAVLKSLNAHRAETEETEVWKQTHTTEAKSKPAQRRKSKAKGSRRLVHLPVSAQHRGDSQRRNDSPRRRDRLWWGEEERRRRWIASSNKWVQNLCWLFVKQSCKTKVNYLTLTILKDLCFSFCSFASPVFLTNMYFPLLT